MKKTKLVLLLFLVIGLVVTGCGESKKEKKQKEKIVEPTLGGWNNYTIEKNIGIDEETLGMFNKAVANFTNVKVDAVALLGKQVVAGTNYMFLAAKYENGEEFDPEYEVVIIYKDLEGNAEIKATDSFDYEKYTNVDIKDKSEFVTGGWEVETPGKLGQISDQHIQEVFDKTTESLTDISFNPIDVIGYQVVNGTNYAIVCYGKTNGKNAKEGIYIVTLYEDLDGNVNLASTAYVDLAAFNK